MNAITHVATFILLATTFLHAPLDAQSVPQLGIGSRVRVMLVGASDWGPSGRVVSLTSDSVTVAADDDARGPRQFHQAAISQLELSVGQHRNALKGMGIGLLIGAGSGAAIGFISGDDRCTTEQRKQFLGCFMQMTAGEKATIGGAALGIVGGLAGVIRGALTRSDDWRTVDQPRTVAPIVDGSGRVGLSLRL